MIAEPVRAELCTARVELEGDRAVVGEVSAELARIGVERGAPAPGCRGVYAQVAIDGDGIAVAIRDGARRSEGRVVSDAAIAASWIDSWLHDDLDGRAWLIAAPVTVPARSVAATTPAIIESSPHVSTFAGSHLAASWEHVWTDDGASADGFGLAGCLRFGRICAGVRGRYVREADRDLELTAMGRSDMSVMATLALPLQAGRMSIAPEVGGGFGRTATRRIETCPAGDPNMPPANCDPMDPTCVPQPAPCDAAGKVYVGDGFSTATYSPRLAAGVRLAIPLFEHVWLDGLFSLSVSPLAHGKAFGDTPTMSPDGSIVPGTLYALPGEPTFGMWLGVGLRVGAQ